MAYINNKKVLTIVRSTNNKEPVLQEKIVTPAEVAQTVAPDSEYDGLSKVVVNAIPSEYVVPSGALEINENGSYDISDKASVNVNVASSGGVDYLAMRLTQTPYEYENSEITKLPAYGFRDDGGIVKATFPNVTSIGRYTFYSCTKLTSINIPKLTSLPANAVDNCDQLQHISFPNVTSIAEKSINSCDNLKSLHLPKLTSLPTQGIYSCNNLESIAINNVTSISATAFYYGYSLLAVIITQTTSIATLTKGGFNYCYHILGTTNSTYNPTGAKDGFIYVPDSLVADYKAATNWSTYADQIKGLSELPQEYKDLYGIEVSTPSGYTLTLNCESDALNTDICTYSIDGGSTYNQFTATTITLSGIVEIMFKGGGGHTSMIIGTTLGADDIAHLYPNDSTANITLTKNTTYYVSTYYEGVGGAD